MRQFLEILVIACREPEARRTVGIGKDIVSQARWRRHFCRAQFQRILFGMAFGRLVEPAGIGEETKVADLQQSIQPYLMLTRPGGGKTECRQDTAMQVAEDKISTGTHHEILTPVAELARVRVKRLSPKSGDFGYTRGRQYNRLRRS